MGRKSAKVIDLAIFLGSYFWRCPMTVAITNGLGNKHVSPSNVSGNGPTGACISEVYQSMGACSSIVDLLSSVAFPCRNMDFTQSGCNYSIAAIDQYPMA